MPNKHAAVKDLRKNQRHAARNAKMKTHVKSLTAQVKTLLKEGKTKEVADLARKLQQAVDKAAKKNIFHSNKSSRRISSLHRSLNKKAA